MCIFDVGIDVRIKSFLIVIVKKFTLSIYHNHSNVLF